MNSGLKIQSLTRESLDLSRWAVVSHKDDSGLGRQATDVREVLGLGYHLAVPSERLVDKPLTPPFEIRLAPTASDDYVRSLLSNLDGIIFFERSDWHPKLLQLARELGVKTVGIPNWEWFRPTDKLWRLCDFFACPTRYTLSVLNREGFHNAMYFPWALNLNAFPKRLVTGSAHLFVHNAGLIDADDRKGTRDTILAFRRTKNKNIRLIVRLQRSAPLPDLDDRIEVRIGNLKSPAELYEQGDVAIQPSKMEGIGFMVLEPVCSGLPVITTNYPPMNEFVHHKEMLVTPRWFKRRAFATTWVPHAHLRLPRINDMTKKIEWAAENDLTTISRHNREWAESTFGENIIQKIWSRLLESVLRGSTSQLIAAQAKV